jgi:hypothetical protein
VGSKLIFRELGSCSEINIDKLNNHHRGKTLTGNIPKEIETESADDKIPNKTLL